jgi:hypothetical protein
MAFSTVGMVTSDDFIDSGLLDQLLENDKVLIGIMPNLQLKSGTNLWNTDKGNKIKITSGHVPFKKFKGSQRVTIKFDGRVPPASGGLPVLVVTPQASGPVVCYIGAWSAGFKTATVIMQTIGSKGVNAGKLHWTLTHR